MAKSDDDSIAIADAMPRKSVLADDAAEAAPDSAYYSPSTRSFYHDRVHGCAMPDDVIDIGHETHAALIEAQGAGKMIVPGPDGAPIAVDRPPPTPEQRAAQTTRFRNAALRDTAWRIADDEPDREVWVAYRAKVRAIDLVDPIWPDEPA